MNTNTLIDALRALDTSSLNWRFALYSTHKTRDGLELEWNICKMRGIPAQAELLKEFLLTKPLADRSVEPYSPLLSDKESIGALEQSHELIGEQINNCAFSIRRATTHAPEDFTSGVLPKPNGYAFFGEQQDGTLVIFMRRGNPFLSGNAARLFTANGDEVAVSDKPILKFAAAVDFLLIGGVCYILSSAVSKEFSLEERHFAIAQQRMKRIADAGIVSDYERLESVAMKSKNARKFADFDKGILEHIARLSVTERDDFLSTYGVAIDLNGRIDTGDPEQCEMVIDLLCCRSCLDPLGRLSVGSNITPRE